MQKKTKYEILLLTIVLITVILIVPTLVVLPFRSDASIASSSFWQNILVDKSEEKIEKQLSKSDSFTVEVFRKSENSTLKMDLEEYIFGVVAGEMPAVFHEEALKSQAIAARSYIYMKTLSKTEGGEEVVAITDTTEDQVYKDEEELKELWKEDYQKNKNKIIEAINETKGMILKYNDTPVSVSYFAISNGYTENSQEYWANEIQYLQSVESPWDKKAPKFIKEYTFTLEEFSEKLQLSNNKVSLEGAILSKTTGKRVKEVKFGNTIFSGKEVRERLNLASSDFTWEVKENIIIFQTKGYGHGVGMSQYGAHYMAVDGANYEDILQYYYNGIEIGEIN